MPRRELDGLASLTAEVQRAGRKRGARDEHGAEDLLAGAPEPPPPAQRKQSSLAQFFQKRGGGGTDAGGGADAGGVADAGGGTSVEAAASGNGGAAAEANGDGDADDEAEMPGWAARGGALLAVVDEMVRHVRDRDAHIFTREEMRWLCLFAGPRDDAAAAANDGPADGAVGPASPAESPLSTPARALYARLFSRRPVAYVLGSLPPYAEIPDARAAAAELGATGFIRLVCAGAGPLTPHAASLLLELLRGRALRHVADVTELRHKGESVAWVREQLRARLALPDPDGAGPSGGGGARCKPGVRAAALRRVASELGGGPFIVLHDAPLAALKLAERLFFAGSYCADANDAAAAEMGVERILPPPAYALSPNDAALPRCPPSRDAWVRVEAATLAAAAYVDALEDIDSAEGWARAQDHAARFEAMLRALTERIGAAPADDAPPGAAFSAAVRASHAAAAALCAPHAPEICSEISANISAVGPAEAEGWDSLRAARPLVARTTIGAVCAKARPRPCPPPRPRPRVTPSTWQVLTVHVSALEKRGARAGACALLRLLLSSPFAPRRRGGWWCDTTRAVEGFPTYTWQMPTAVAVRHHSRQLLPPRGRCRLALNAEQEAGARKPAGLLAAAAVASSGLADATVTAGHRAELTWRARRAAVHVASAASTTAVHVAPPPLPPPLREARVVVVGAAATKCAASRVRYFGEGARADSGICHVEELVIAEYASHGWSGVHCETGLYTTLFALLCRGLLFDASPPDVFRSRFQDAPLDLRFGCGEFTRARRAAADARLAAISAMDGAEIAAEVRAAHAAHAGTRCAGVSWSRYADADALATMAGCLGGSALGAIFAALADDYSGWRGGMPDLLVWRVLDGGAESAAKTAEAEVADENRSPHAPSGGGGGAFGEARLVEVKSRTDELSHQQRAWIHLLLTAGVHVEARARATTSNNNSAAPPQRRVSRPRVSQECRVLPDAETDVHAIRPGGESCDGRTKVEAAAIKSTGAKRRANKRPRSARGREAAGGASNGGVAAADREYVNLISSSDDES